MSMTRDEAALALQAMETAQRRASVLANYAGQGAHLMLWGAIWFVCNLVSQFAPSFAGWAWLGASALGVGVGVLARRQGAHRPRGRRALATLVTVFGFLGCLLTVAAVDSGARLDAMISLSVAAAYVVIGIWGGARYAWLGLALVALILVGWFGLRAHFFLWMAFVGGGALALGGAWLLRA